MAKRKTGKLVFGDQRMSSQEGDEHGGCGKEERRQAQHTVERELLWWTTPPFAFCYFNIFFSHFNLRSFFSYTLVFNYFSFFYIFSSYLPQNLIYKTEFLLI